MKLIVMHVCTHCGILRQIFCNGLRSNSSGSGANVSSGGSDTNSLLENATATGNSNDTNSASSVGSSSGN